MSICLISVGKVFKHKLCWALTDSLFMFLSDITSVIGFINRGSIVFYREFHKHFDYLTESYIMFLHNDSIFLSVNIFLIYGGGPIST